MVENQYLLYNMKSIPTPLFNFYFTFYVNIPNCLKVPNYTLYIFVYKSDMNILTIYVNIKLSKFCDPAIRPLNLNIYGNNDFEAMS